MQSKDEAQLQSDVLAELDSDPQVDVDRVFVDVNGDVVRLTGTVPDLHYKHAALQAAQRVKGVAAVVEQLHVEVPPWAQRHDADVGRTIARQLHGDVAIPTTVHVSVIAGNVILTGTVHSQFERAGAASLAQRVIGVRSVTNAIVLNPRTRKRHATNTR